MVSMPESTSAIAQLAALYGLAIVDLDMHVPDPQLVSRFPSHLLFRETMVPLSLDARRCIVAVSDPTKLESLDQLEKFSPRPIEPVLAPSDQIKKQLHRLLGLEAAPFEI